MKKHITRHIKAVHSLMMVTVVVVVVHVGFRARNMVVVVMSVVVSVGLRYFCLHRGSWVSSDHSPGFNRNNLISGLVLFPDKKQGVSYWNGIASRDNSSEDECNKSLIEQHSGLKLWLVSVLGWRRVGREMQSSSELKNEAKVWPIL